MSDYALEIELKYAATPAALAALADAERIGPALLGVTVVNDETDRYLDTPDRRLLGSRLGLPPPHPPRRGRGPNVRVAQRAPPSRPSRRCTAARRSRRSAPDDPDPARLAPVRRRASSSTACAPSAPLIEFVGLAQLRRERPVVVDGRSIGTLSLDEVTVLRGGVRARPLRRD